MSSITYECSKKGCFHCCEINRLETLNNPLYQPPKINKLTGSRYYKRIIQGLKTPQEQRTNN